MTSDRILDSSALNLYGVTHEKDTHRMYWQHVQKPHGRGYSQSEDARIMG